MRWTGGAAVLCVAAAMGAAAAAQERPVLRYVPTHEELKYTFGGVPPIRRIAPGTRIISWTEDCYDGAVTKPGQMPTPAGIRHLGMCRNRKSAFSPASRARCLRLSSAGPPVV